MLKNTFSSYDSKPFHSANKAQQDSFLKKTILLYDIQYLDNLD